jgi:DNA (cytosine-5)-methyltransferase 3A
MNILSLFDGISCARVALERSGIKIDKYYASEIDKYAIQIAQKNYPDTIQLGDVVTINTPMLKGIDLMIGGSPCQDLSIAGKRKGLGGERSGLFWEYVRILKEVRPKFFILENVNSMSKENRQIITDALGVEPVMINAALVSAQNRKRLFWVGKLVGNKYEQVDIPQPEDKGILLKDIIETDVDEKYFLNKDYELTPSKNNLLAGTLDKGTWAKRFEQIRRVWKLENKAPTLPTGAGGGVITKIVAPNGKQIIPNGEEIRDMKFEVAKKFDKTVNIAILEERKRILNEMQDIEDGSYCDVQTPNWRLLKNRINK